jgi:hypothetical protein
MSTNTARLALVKPAGLEPQDIAVLNADLDKIDKMMGCILVNAGVTPPDADLFDGAIVKEKTTGITWVAQWNGTTYDKRYITTGPWVQHTAPNTVVSGSVNTSSGAGGIWYRRNGLDIQFAGNITPTTGPWTGNPTLVNYTAGLPLPDNPTMPATAGPAFYCPDATTGGSATSIGLRVQSDKIVLIYLTGTTTGRQFALDGVRYPYLQ